MTVAAASAAAAAAVAVAKQTPICEGMIIKWAIFRNERTQLRRKFPCNVNKDHVAGGIYQNLNENFSHRGQTAKRCRI